MDTVILAGRVIGLFWVWIMLWLLSEAWHYRRRQVFGKSPLSIYRDHLDACEVVDKARHAAMTNLRHPSAVLTFEHGLPTTEAERERIKARYEKALSGDAGGLFISPPGNPIPKTEWVSCKDRCSEKGERVLLYMPGRLGVCD